MENLKQQKSQQQSEDPGFELEPCSGPLWDTVAFLEARKLGPAGLPLPNALTGYKRLTEAQETLLQKVLAKMRHPGYLEPILLEISSLRSALTEVDKLCQTSALVMK